MQKVIPYKYDSTWHTAFQQNALHFNKIINHSYTNRFKFNETNSELRRNTRTLYNTDSERSVNRYNVQHTRHLVLSAASNRRHSVASAKLRSFTTKAFMTEHHAWIRPNSYELLVQCINYKHRKSTQVEFIVRSFWECWLVGI